MKNNILIIKNKKNRVRSSIRTKTRVNMDFFQILKQEMHFRRALTIWLLAFSQKTSILILIPIWGFINPSLGILSRTDLFDSLVLFFLTSKTIILDLYNEFSLYKCLIIQISVEDTLLLPLMSSEDRSMVRNINIP